MKMNSDVRGAHCVRCGASLASGANNGFCARCLLSTVLRTLNAAGESLAELESTASLLIRREFAGYELLGELGRGGMGVVFKARQKAPDRLVALKVVAAGELASPRVLSRFRLEAKTAAGLHHPNIVPLFEVGEWSGWHFFSMQLIEGPTLAEVLRKGGIGPEAAVRLVLAITRAVQYAPERGILHRDIKPTNILLDSAGEPHLTDFGLAKVLDQDSDLTLSRAILGTPAYMSPEQAAGRKHDITTATDVYAIGALFYEMLAGRPPFLADSTPALLRKVVEEEPIPPSRICDLRFAIYDLTATGDAGRHSPNPKSQIANRKPQIPHDLEVICLKCLEKNPGRRYGSAAELVEELGRWVDGKPIRARPGSPWEHGWKWVKRNPARGGTPSSRKPRSDCPA
ncbi:MAG: serine/threonine protein kinase [Verrucomicrobia bacterium]|nr:serine/threonine protein kinase [Verrucomicrobiota bacterium]